MLVDTHTHLYLEEFDIDGGGIAAVSRAIDAGVGHLVFPNVDLGTIAPMKELAAKFPDHVSTAMGLHPTEVGENWEEDTDIALSDFDIGAHVAVGEIGIDLYWDKTYEREQMLSFERQVDFAATHSLPVIIHCRDGLDQALEVLGGKKVGGVFHSFGGTADDVERIRRVGDYHFGINGVVTFKNCHVRDSLPAIGTDRILLETDSPYLAPVPKRGKRNESAYLPFVAQHIADHLGLPFEEIAEKTTVNAKRLFKINNI